MWYLVPVLVTSVLAAMSTSTSHWTENAFLVFWERSINCFMPPMRTLNIPASISLIEWVLSQGFVIMRPHSARMTEKLLSQLTVLKCNWFIANNCDNILPVEVTSTNSPQTFKTKLKSNLFLASFLKFPNYVVFVKCFHFNCDVM